MRVFYDLPFGLKPTITARMNVTSSQNNGQQKFFNAGPCDPTVNVNNIVLKKTAILLPSENVLFSSKFLVK